MKNILLLLMVMLFVFSCKKNGEELNKIEVYDLAGNWSAAYLNKSIQLKIDEAQNFSLSLPVVVKKESNAAPVELNISLKGICVREDAGYVLRIEGFAEAKSGNLEEMKNLVYQSLEGVQVEMEQNGGGEHMKSARLSAENGKLLIHGL